MLWSIKNVSFDSTKINRHLKASLLWNVETLPFYEWLYSCRPRPSSETPAFGVPASKPRLFSFLDAHLRSDWLNELWRRHGFQKKHEPALKTTLKRKAIKKQWRTHKARFGVGFNPCGQRKRRILFFCALNHFSRPPCEPADSIVIIMGLLLFAILGVMIELVSSLQSVTILFHVKIKIKK